MAFTGNISAFLPQASFDGTGTRTVNLNIFVTNESNENQTLDDIYLTLTDSEGAVSIHEDVDYVDGYIYQIDVDVGGYPSGDITAEFTCEIDSDTLTFSKTIEYGDSPDVVVVNGLEAQYTSNKAVLNQAHTFNIRLTNGAGVYIDGYAARVLVRDVINSVDKCYIDAELQATGSGLWSATYTFDSSNFEASLTKYQYWWEWKSDSSVTAWSAVSDTITELEIESVIADIKSGSLGYCDTSYIRKIYPGIDSMLSQTLDRQGDRELVLQQMIYDISAEIHSQAKYTKSRGKPELLKQLTGWTVVYDAITLHGAQFNRSSSQNQQLVNIKQKLFRLKQSIVGHQRIASCEPPGASK